MGRAVMESIRVVDTCYASDIMVMIQILPYLRKLWYKPRVVKVDRYITKQRKQTRTFRGRTVIIQVVLWSNSGNGGSSSNDWATAVCSNEESNDRDKSAARCRRLD
jgi:hypothetical protein